MLAVAFHADLDLASEEGLRKGGALGAPEGDEITGADQTYVAGKSTVHRCGGCVGTLRIGKDVEVGKGVAHEKLACGGKVLVRLARKTGDHVRA